MIPRVAGEEAIPPTRELALTMPHLLALSCFQSRTQDAALDELLALRPDGVQLTPGCLPSEGFEERVARECPAIRLHHGFSWRRYRREAWTSDGAPLIVERERSLHPPRGAHEVPIQRILDGALQHDLLLETMYPGEPLGTGEEIELALDAGVRLAVDTSHLFIQRRSGVLPERVLARLLESPLVEEVHVSENDGRRDLHRTISGETYLLSWARERSRDLPVVLESYWHRVPPSERERQFDLLRA